MAGTTIPYQIVILTNHHSITGGIFLHDQRLSDFLNDRRDKKILLRNPAVSRIESPGRVLEKTLVSFLPKSEILLAYELPQKKGFPPRFIKYPKERYPVYIVLDAMEIHGEVHIPGALDLLHVLTDAGDSFLPVTNATVAIEANPDLIIQQDTVLVNTQRICFIGDLEPQKTAETLP